MDTKENKTIKFIIIAVLIIAVISLIGVAFARYITRLNGTTQAPIARWNFRVTAGSSENLQIDLADTRYVNDTTEVDRTKVAPGTKGAIQLNVDGSGSQVSLQYNIDLTLTQIPENLMFYEDEEMTTALLKENGKIHLDGYFGVNDVNKTATKNLYWQWKLETGTTQAEIDSNDLLDSAWIGERITLGIEATGKQVVDNPSTKYAVTFDLNGGTLANHGDSTQLTKQVTYGETYGNLPVPTREGYAFVGWGEKNLFDEQTVLLNIQGASKTEEGYYRFRASNAYRKYKNLNIGFDKNARYTITVTGFMDSGSFTVGIVYEDDTWESAAVWKETETTYTLTSNPEKKIKCFYLSYGTDGIANIKHIQIEKGKSSTEYEPYNIIENEENVIKEYNHTLIAIWEGE